MRDIDNGPARAGAPWWRFGIVWFALAGPALVVVASFATMAIAFAHADLPIPEVPKATTNAGRAAPTAPALQARNHAATPQRRDAP
jgi:hypothetical protein